MALLLPWALVPFVVFTPVPSRLSWYVSPALPAVVILIGITVQEVVRTLLDPISRRYVLRCFTERDVPTSRWHWRLTLALACICILLVSISLNVSRRSVAHDITRDEKVPMHQCISILQDSNVQQLRLYVAGDVQLDRIEVPHVNILRPQIQLHSSQEVHDVLHSGGGVAILAPLSLISQLPLLTTDIGYFVLPAFRDRSHPLVMNVRLS